MQSRRPKFSIRRLLGILFLSSLTFCLWLGHISSTAQPVGFGDVVTAQTPDASQLVQQGIEQYQAGNFKGAIEPWQTALNLYQKSNNRANEAIVLENLARAYQQLSRSEQAIAYWDRAIAYYRQVKDWQQVGRMLTEQAQAYSSSGQLRRAIALLCGASSAEQSCTSESALQIARTYQDRLGEAAALGSLGDAYRLKGDYEQASVYLQAGLELANEIDNPLYRVSALNSLGNVYISYAQVSYRRASSAEQRGISSKVEELKQEALSYDTKALNYFRDSIELARTQNDLLGQMRGLLNSIPPYYRMQADTAATEALQKAQLLLDRLPDSRDKVYAAIDLAHLLQPVTLFDEASSKTKCFKPELEATAATLLKQAVSIAQRLEDRRAESFALGELGHVYECRKDYEQAQNFTQQAQWAADQDLLAKDSLYLWEWQAGRLFKAQGKSAEAIAAYEQAIATLEAIRDDILVANRDLQFDFRDTVEPIYRELVALRLDLETTSSSLKAIGDSRKNLSAVLGTIDSLKLAELQNYFGNDCVLTAVNEGRIDLVGADTNTAVFNSIILDDRTAIIVSFPNGEKKFAWIDIASKTLRQQINEYRRGLERFYDPYNPTQAQQIYDWIVRPFASELEQAQIKTLVFVQDGILRSVPMAALHDGEKFLIEKYAIATTPSLTLTDPKVLNRQELRALTLGVTKSVTVDGYEFRPLSNVGLEISQINAQIPGSKPLLNEAFTRDRLQQELSQDVYPIIHIATHGEFGTVPEDTFIVTGNNEKLTLNELDRILRRVAKGTDKVELLALTACKTAVGDERAALGLAGVAVQAGARSALASLWYVNDSATAQIAINFYTSLHSSSLNKAEALRAAQLALINDGSNYAHPAYWASFILVGNWL